MNTSPKMRRGSVFPLSFKPGLPSLVEHLLTFPLELFFVKLYQWIFRPDIADFSWEPFCFHTQAGEWCVKNNKPPPIFFLVISIALNPLLFMQMKSWQFPGTLPTFIKTQNVLLSSPKLIFPMGKAARISSDGVCWHEEGTPFSSLLLHWLRDQLRLLFPVSACQPTALFGRYF